MTEIAIVGGSGYTGGELIRLLQKHPDAEIKSITSRQYNGTPVDKIHPHIRGSNLIFEDISPKNLDADIVFTATPHGVSMNIVPEILEVGSKVIDLSGDYRFNDIDNYEKWYNIKHIAPIEAVYGLPEIHRKEIKKAKLVANPGCFPTGAILANLPLSKEELVENIIVDSKTGVSGGGVNPSTVFHYPNCADNVVPYNLTRHRHGPEIQQELGAFSNVKVSFTPHLVPVIRGILTTSHSFLKSFNDNNNNVSIADNLKEETEKEIIDIYKKQYKNEPFVKILDDGEIPTLNSVRGSNFAHIGGFEIDDNGRLIVISAIDNLVKGASGQAIHNMNLMCGFKEETAIDGYGMRP
ncbi:N-acetyl-gamma-glutamyl-phosphate reductase [Methanobrevibacter sp. TMH8]|uniref:N-acetyl-gamma-glutamyl-phosphate reductase n=1 Tax=Methanobrevibacter sp. TMH8 TaxID=2848611 RepID=UPI001CCAAF39|nr:N-acetyl-gamma-glutamyl-phosphate reductase [Methanobrevibacter sp. TMH8]MBZ9571475.1 N-acetyl-gamma-glutamyl-phosphate reductase [Methanobrevibacter sp. TMH8]